MTRTKTYNKLVDNSVAAALSAIEVYNKPDFKYRNEVFTILIINSWELLIKAKILKDHSDNIKSIYIVSPKGGYKKNRHDNYLTLDFYGALNKTNLNNVIKENLIQLVEIRDTATHFYNDLDLDYVIYSLGAAALKNFQKCINDWFHRSLLEYNFYIMPLGFSYQFKTISTIEVGKKPEEISNIIKQVSEKKSELREDQGYFFTCEIQARVISAKKIIDDPDITVAIDPSEKSTVIFRNQNLIDRYPLSYHQLFTHIKKINPKIKQNDFNTEIKKFKGNSRFSAYNFRTKKQEDDYRASGFLPKGIVAIYNEEAKRSLENKFKKGKRPRKRSA